MFSVPVFRHLPPFLQASEAVLQDCSDAQSGDECSPSTRLRPPARFFRHHNIQDHAVIVSALCPVRSINSIINNIYRIMVMCNTASSACAISFSSSASSSLISVLLILVNRLPYTLCVHSVCITKKHPAPALLHGCSQPDVRFAFIFFFSLPVSAAALLRLHTTENIPSES